MSRHIKLGITALLISILQLNAYGDDTAGQAESKPKAPKASFFLIGGSANAVLADFVTLAGGEKANVAIITHASATPAEEGDNLQNALAALGVKRSTVVLPGSKAGIPKDATSIYMIGGDQARLKRLIDENLLEQISSFEGIIAGSSAGSMIAAPKMIARGMDNTTVRAEELRVTDGLSFLPHCVIDTHVGARSRDTRSLAALALIGDAEMSIGIDEDTAIYVKNGVAKVYGQGHVRTFTRGQGFISNIATTKRGQVANVKNVIFSAYCEGDEFDMPAEKVTDAAPKADK